MYVLPVRISTLTSIVTLMLVFDLSLMPFDIFRTVEAVRLSTLLFLTCTSPEDYFCGTFNSVTSLWSLGVHIPAYNLKYLDRDRRPVQCMS